MSFAEFLHAQLRPWIYEGLRVLTRGSAGQFSLGEDAVFWGLVEGLRAELAAGRLTETIVMSPISFAVGDVSAKVLQIPQGIPSPQEWPKVAFTRPPPL